MTLISLVLLYKNPNLLLGGDFDIICMDEFIDNLLREERAFDTILPRLTKRHVLEENDELPPRISALEDDLEDDLPE